MRKALLLRRGLSRFCVKGIIASGGASPAAPVIRPAAAEVPFVRKGVTASEGAAPAA